MKLAPEAIAFLGRPPDTAPKARAVHGYAGSICEQSKQHTPKEPDMPRGIYPRKKAATLTQATTQEVAATEQAGRRKKARKPHVQTRLVELRRQKTEARFGVFDDGSVEVRLPTCQGTMTPDEASGFLGFIKRLQG